MTHFKDIAHLYAGCKVYFDDRVGVVTTFYLPYGTEKKEDKLWFVSLEEDIEGSELSCSVSVLQIKPILRPLSNMTEEERDDLISIANLNKELFKNPAAITIYLLSKSFDLFNLIESGQAIDVITLK